MATPPSFTSGEVLTAAQMNAVGMWLIKTQAVAAGGTSFTVTSVFSSDYRNYRVVFDNIGGTAGNSAFFQINGSTGSTYTSNGRYMSSGANADAQIVDTGFWLGIMGTAFSGSIDLYRPNLVAATTATCLTSSSTFTNIVAGYDSNAAASTGFTLRLAAGTLTAGSVSVYGYND